MMTAKPNLFNALTLTLKCILVAAASFTACVAPKTSSMSTQMSTQTPTEASIPTPTETSTETLAETSIPTQTETSTQTSTKAPAPPDTLKMVFAGDVMGHDMQITGAWRDGGDTSYNYHPVFQYIGDYISTFDIALANLEVTLAGPPYKGYPEFSTHKSLAVALKDVGFNVLVTANNHSLDRGKKGLESTLDALDCLGITHTGTFRDSAEWRATYPLIVEKNNFRLAILNYTYGTNGIPVTKPNVVSLIDTAQIAADHAKAKALNPDYIITCIHWGDEYQNKENATQRSLAAFLAKHGTNLIIGSHPHVVQPLSTVNDSVHVIYSLGNFVSNQRDRYRDGGITLEATLIKKDGKVTTESVGYEPFHVYRYHEDKKPPAVFRLIRVNDYLKRPERYPVMDAEDKKLMMRFYDDTKATMGR